MARKKPYREGDWFLVPLERHPGSFGLGLIARTGSRGSVAGFFFGPAVREAPPEGVRRALRPVDAVLVSRFTDLGFLEDGWPILGRNPGWGLEREAWRLPEFAHLDGVDPELAFGRRYDDADPFGPWVEERTIPLEEAQWMPSDGFAGHGLVGWWMARLLLEDAPLPAEGPTVWPEGVRSSEEESAWLLVELAERDDCDVLPPQGQPDTGHWQLPDDLATFYGLHGGGVLFESGLASLGLSTPKGFVPVDRVMWDGEPPSGTSSESWFVFANDGGGTELSIDLRPERHGWCYDTQIGRYGGPGDCTVIALSFTEFLRRSLAMNGQDHYWLQDGFVPYGDAYDTIE